MTVNRAIAALHDADLIVKTSDDAGAPYALNADGVRAAKILAARAEAA